MKHIQDNKKYKDPSGNLFKRGELYTNPINGKIMVFDSYISSGEYKTGDFRGYYIMYFVTRERFKEIEIRRKNFNKKVKKLIKQEKIKLKKRINPITKEPFKQNDTKIIDGTTHYFLGYKDQKEGEFINGKKEYYELEVWLDKDDYLRRNINRIFHNRKSKSKKIAREFSVDFDYVLSIFPKNNKCPITKKPFKLGGSYIGKGNDNKDSPSLDRIDPRKGYIKGNLVWVSRGVNAAKFDATVDELFTVGNFYKKLSLR